MMDLSKANECLSHDLLIAKLAAYGFDNTASAIIADYIINCLQRVKIGSLFCSDLEILRVVGPYLTFS